MMPRWGTLVALGMLLVIAGCTRDAGVQPFEAVPPSGDAETTPLSQPSPTTIPITVNAQGAETAEAVDAEPTDEPVQEDATLPPTETDIPALIVTDTPTTAPTNTVPPSPTPRPSNTPSQAASEPDPTEEQQSAGVDSMVEGEETPTDSAPAGGFTPSVPQPFPSDTPMPTSTPLVTREPLVTPTQDGDISETVDAEGVPTGDGCTYVVRAGDNAFRIAVNNNVTLAELREANPSLAASNPIIQPGQELQIPGCGGGTRVETPEDTTAETENELVTPVPEGLVEYTVQSGDTLLQIARTYNSTITDIVETNDLDSPDRLSIGQVLLIPENSADADDEDQDDTEGDS